MKSSAIGIASRTQAERLRMLAEYDRRTRELDSELYAPWNAAEMFLRSHRKRVAATLLRRRGVFPGPASHCLEVGVGPIGWLADLIGWGVPEKNLHGIDLNESRIERARSLLPAADLLAGDASALPWPDRRFDLVIASTVLTSVLDPLVRREVAAEILRVLAPGGALLWYDFAVNNPRNSNVRRVGRRELNELFPPLSGPVRRITLAPPIARLVAPVSWPAAEMLALLPFLRTHLLAVLVKESRVAEN
jgi:ubiquinone/menaquinone biosynthesis C-methylase UbiE